MKKIDKKLEVDCGNYVESVSADLQSYQYLEKAYFVKDCVFDMAYCMLLFYFIHSVKSWLFKE